MKKYHPSDNTNLKAKIEIREKIKAVIKNINLLECYAGNGEIYKICYENRINNYVGIDKKNNIATLGRNIIHGDTRKILRSKLVDLNDYNLFDLDSWGSPWYPFWIICNRIKNNKFDKIGFVFTDGLQQKAQFGKIESGMSHLVGLGSGITVPCLSRHKWYLRSLIIRKGIEKLNMKIINAWIGTNGSTCDYIGITTEKNI